MSTRNLDNFLTPASVALVGASSKPGSVGQMILANLVDGGFPGPVYAINPRPIDHPGAIWAPTIEALPSAPDLAIVATPAETIPDVIARLGARGTRSVVVISAGLSKSNGLRQAMLDAARPHTLRIVGPNCIGMLMPHARLNASFARAEMRPGRLALISQSGALVTAILDWASARDIGFSGVVSVGDMADVDLGDLIGLFAADPNTDAILLYVEGATNPAKFIAAARDAAAQKPVIAIKAGRTAAARKAALSHTGALAGSWEVYRSVFRRAGIVMVDNLTDMFDAAEILCETNSISGNGLGIVTNGGGAGILAADALGQTSGHLAELAPATIATLDAALPSGWSHANPVDVIGDAHADRYRAAIAATLADPAVDALLVMHCPVAIVAADEIARATVEAVAGADKPVVACWLGDANAASVRPVFAEAGIPIFTTPDDAVRGLGYLLDADAARRMLTATPAAEAAPCVDHAAAQAIIAGARAEGRTLLSEVEAKALLAACCVPVVPTRLARTPEDIPALVADLTGPYVVKLVSPEITHKSDVGGVALNLPDAEAAVAAARAMADRITARIEGFAVQPMIRRPHAHELIVGIADDPTFGPVLMVGAGGKAVEVVKDRAFGLPPLDDGLARAMIAETRIARLLAGYRDEPPADIAGVASVLVSLSQLAIDFPDIAELDINPLLVDAEGAIALDARIRITAEANPPSRIVISPRR